MTHDITVDVHVDNERRRLMYTVNDGALLPGKICVCILTAELHTDDEEDMYIDAYMRVGLVDDETQADWTLPEYIIDVYLEEVDATPTFDGIMNDYYDEILWPDAKPLVLASYGASTDKVQSAWQALFKPLFAALKLSDINGR